MGTDDSLKTRETPASVTCRSNGLGYAAGVLVLIYGVAVTFLSSPDGKHTPIPPAIRLGIGSVFLLGAILFFWWERIAHVTANREGVVWRTLFKTRQVRWDEVTDYYYSFVGSSHTGKGAVVRTASAVIRLNSDWKNTEAVCDMIQRFATHAPVADWQVIGTRPCDPWPRIFDYYPIARQWLLTSQIVLGLGYLYTVTVLLWHQMHSTFRILGSHYVIGVYSLSCLVTVPFGFCLLCGVLQTAASLRRYGDDIWAVTPQGFTFISRGIKRDIPWSEVGDYHTEKRSFVEREYVISLCGADETQIRWGYSIYDCLLLACIVRKYAPRPQSAVGSTTGWRAAVPPSTGGRFRASPALSGRKFHYRTGELFPILLGATILLVCLSSIPLLYSFLDLPERFDANGTAIGIAAAGLALLYCWWRYFAGGIEIDDFWITQKTLFGYRRILWLAVSDYKEKNGTYYTLGRDEKRIVFWSALNQVEELKAEIERRSPTPQIGWSKKAVENPPRGSHR
ncbi:MAG: hypothetical protein V4671_26505 [Armatimonadota bacterium]